jgi:outer membrane protein assembly factor BamB
VESHAHFTHPEARAQSNNHSRRTRARSVRYRPGLTLIALLALAAPLPARAQLCESSWWPKLQRDAQNTGYVPLLGFVTDPHVRWYVKLSEPVASESHGTPVLSPDNTRLYVGLPGAAVTAVNTSDGTVAWTLTFGDGTARFCNTPAVGADGSIYVGSWDSNAPYDGFVKIRDDGDHGTLVWTYPMRVTLASPTITPAGLVVVGGRHADGTWAYFAIEDLGDTCQTAWVAGQFADPADPGSIGAIGASPALSGDGTWIFGGSWENRTFWQIDALTGYEQARLPLDQYCYAANPVVSDDGFVFIGEGASFTAPDPATEGKLYVFEPDETGAMQELDALPLYAGHLNGGTAALYLRPDDRLRLLLPAGGYGASAANLIALDFDPAGPTADPPTAALKKIWQTSLGSAAVSYGQAVVTRDGIVYVLGPANHRLYAIRSAANTPSTAWTLDLATITRAPGTSFSGKTGPMGVTVGPDGTIYWTAVDGYLYAIRGWLNGDLDGDGQLTTTDLDWLVTALVNPDEYSLRFPEIDAEIVGDVNGDGRLDFFDLNRLLELLAG